MVLDDLFINKYVLSSHVVSAVPSAGDTAVDGQDPLSHILARRDMEFAFYHRCRWG